MNIDLATYYSLDSTVVLDEEQMLKGRNVFKALVKYSGAACFILVALLIVYMIKGIYPFGNRSIAYFDMTQYIIPAYYHTWDVLHGSKALFWDWYSGLGGSMADKVGTYIFNPINLFFFFIKRESIVDFMSYFLIIKMGLIATSMSFYISKRFKTEKATIIAWGGIVYASCGFVIQYYSFIAFLDIVMLFPLIVYSLELMIGENKVLWYIVFMTLGFITNIQLMYMVCLYIVLKVGIELVKVEKEKKEKIISRLAITTAIALAISSFSWLPMTFQILDSSRSMVQYNVAYMDAITISRCQEQCQKNFMLYGSEWIFVIIISLIVNKTSKADYKKRLAVFALITVPIIFESINLLWHPGGYVLFPMRFGYMIPFESICFVVEHFHDFECQKQENTSLLNKVFMYLAIALVPFCVVILFSYGKGFLEKGIRDYNMYNGYEWVMLVISFTVLLALLSQNRYVILGVLWAVAISQAFIGMYSFIGPVKDSPECNVELLRRAAIVSDEYGFERSLSKRAKNEDTSLITNWAFVVGDAALNNWTWGVNPNLCFILQQLGYSDNYTKLVDNGGTIFSDNLLGISKLITADDMDEDLYSLREMGSISGYYDYRYSLPFGIIANSETEYDFTENVFDNQNALWRGITGLDSDLFEQLDISELDVDAKSEGKMRLTIPVNGNKTLYMYSQKNCYEYSMIINEKQKKFPALAMIDNIYYPSWMYSGLIECGVFHNENVVVDLNVLDIYGIGYDYLQDDIRVGLMDMDLLEAMYADIGSRQNLDVMFYKQGMEIKGNVNRAGILCFPVGYNKGWRVLYNNVRAEAGAWLNHSLLAIPVNEGYAEIKIKYNPPGFISGLIVSIGCLLMLALYTIRTKKHEINNRILLKTNYFLFGILFYGVLIFIYVVPIVVCTFCWILKR